MILSIVAISWLLLVLISVPIGISMILVSMAYFYWTGMGLNFALSRMIDGLNSFPLLAVPLFILAAAILNGAGITNILFGFARALVGHIRGGLGHVNVLASLFFSGMSGSALADAGGLGKMEIAAMRQAGYDDEFSGSVTAASSMTRLSSGVRPVVPMTSAFFHSATRGALPDVPWWPLKSMTMSHAGRSSARSLVIFTPASPHPAASPASLPRSGS